MTRLALVGTLGASTSDGPSRRSARDRPAAYGLAQECSAPSDDQLMVAARAGDRSAFDTIIRRHQQIALALARRHVGDPHLAEDVVQDAFVELYRVLPRYRPQGKLRAFLLRIVLSRAKMARRSAARARLVLEPVTDPQVRPEVTDAILTAERQRVLQRAIDKLPEAQRAVIALRFGSGLSHAETAQVLRIPEGTVKSRLFNALKRLRRTLVRSRPEGTV